jgi:putative endonuclease
VPSSSPPATKNIATATKHSPVILKLAPSPCELKDSSRFSAPLTPSIGKTFANDKKDRYNRFALRENLKGGFVYILAGKSGVLYVGVTANLYVRVVQHRQKLIDGFTKKYEQFGDIRNAIAREKQLKGWLRRRKIALIESTNPTWRDLFDDFSPPATKNNPVILKLARSSCELKDPSCLLLAPFVHGFFWRGGPNRAGSQILLL